MRLVPMMKGWIFDTHLSYCLLFKDTYHGWRVVFHRQGLVYEIGSYDEGMDI